MGEASEEHREVAPLSRPELFSDPVAPDDARSPRREQRRDALGHRLRLQRAALVAGTALGDEQLGAGPGRARGTPGRQVVALGRVADPPRRNLRRG